MWKSNKENQKQNIDLFIEQFYFEDKKKRAEFYCDFF